MGHAEKGETLPASVGLVEVTSDGTLCAFVIGHGLVPSTDEGREFKTVSAASATPPLLHLAVDPQDPSWVFAAAGRGPVLMSTDRGRTWTAFGRSAQGAEP